MFDKLSHLTKRQMFGVIIGVIVAIGLIVSIITNITYFTYNEDDALRIAVAGPMTGDSARIGQSMKQGVELYIDIINKNNGVDGNFLKADIYDDRNDPAEAKKVATEIAGTKANAVIGHWTSETVRAGGKVYADKGIQLVVPSSVDPEVIKENDWVASSLFSNVYQARFLANYTRNVLGHKLVSMIVDKRSLGETLGNNFRDTYKRFGTKIRYTWEYDSTEPVVPQMIKIVEELKGYKDAGALFLAVNEIDGARLIKLIRDAGIRNIIVGPNSLVTKAFSNKIEELPGKNLNFGHYTNRMMVTAPLLFDTANETAQNFKNSYIEKFGEDPDWVAAYAYDTAHMIVQALKTATADEEAADNLASVRESIKLDLAGRLRVEDSIPGVSGNTFFSEQGEAQKPAFIGVYSGTDVVSALTQLQPIKPGGNRNYIADLKRGRVLYVNDRFMYKTNVVYTGLQVKEISAINREENRFNIDFLIWFRYRGNFEPQDLKFINAVEPVKLENPEDEQQIGDMTYRLYRVKADFQFNFSNSYRVYGDQLVGVAFSHNKLNKNNLQYVVDVLGVALAPGETMRTKLENNRALKASSGWVIDRAWISQDIMPEGTLGNPAYVGYASDDPEFSQIDHGIIIQKGEIKIRDFIPAEYFIYIAIFAFVGSFFALAMDRKERGRFWAAQSWFLRLVSWPFLLLSVGNLLLDYATQSLPEHYIDIIILMYEFIWWIIPARIVGIALERFLWAPLEDHTERMIPNVIRVFGSVVVYSFAACGIIAFVFEQQLASLLATGGLITMIIGLAVQSNIANIFSGIVINMERPFNVGDWVIIGDVDEGRVVDITWRTTRVKVRNGYVVSIPNGQVSEAQIHNFNSFDTVRIELPLYLDAKYPMMATSDIMEEGLNKAPNILDAPEREVRFKGIERQYNVWVCEYEIQFWIENYGRREETAEQALASVWDELAKHGIRPYEEDSKAVAIGDGAVEMSSAGE